MNICSTYLKLKKFLTYLTLTEFGKLNATLQHFTRNCRIENLDDFERDEADVYFWRAGLLYMKDKGMSICYIMNRCLVMFLSVGEKMFYSIDEALSQS